MNEERIRKIVEGRSVSIGRRHYELRLLATRALPDGGAHVVIGIAGHERTLTLPLTGATLVDDARVRTVVEHWVKEVVSGRVGEDAKKSR